MEDFEEELKHDFLTESVDLLQDAESAFLRLEEERENPELLNEIFRVAHNLKGTSKAVGFDQMCDITHIAENLILKLKEGQLEITDTVVSGLLNFKDFIGHMVEGLQSDLSQQFNLDKIRDELVALTNPNDANAQPEDNLLTDTSSIDATPEGTLKENTSETDHDEQTFDRHGEAEQQLEETHTLESDNKSSSATSGNQEISHAALESLRELGLESSFDELNSDIMSEDRPLEKTESVQLNSPDETSLTKSLINSDTEVTHDKKNDLEFEKGKNSNFLSGNKEGSKKISSSKPVSKEETLRVGLGKIEKINNVIGELIILQTLLNQRKVDHIKDELCSNSISMMSKLFREIQETAMSLRMVPLKTVFQKMNRIVRDTSTTLGKNVKLITSGEETEVEKTVLEKISDPLVHIIRNAVDHGQETAQERKLSKKDSQGKVSLRAHHEGSNIAIEIIDDGKGINPEVIKKKAQEKKIIPIPSSMSEHELIQLIFHPGFSTKEQVTEVSGRGVGMDVVKTNIEALGGKVSVESKLGEGSKFKILIPLTLAIIDGLVINVSEEKFVLPLNQVSELTQIERTEIETFTNGANLFRLRGDVLPIFELNTKLGHKPKQAQRPIVAVINNYGKSFGIIIDDIINQQQIVIKKLGEDLRGKQGIMGSAIMSDGLPALILDIFEIFKNDIKENSNFAEFKNNQLQSAA